MLEQLLFYLCMAPFLCIPFLIIGLFWLGRRRRAAVREVLRQAGFESCPNRLEWLHTTINGLVMERRVKCKVLYPLRLTLDRGELYACWVRWSGPDSDGDTSTSWRDDIFFLVPLVRPRPDPVTLVLRPPGQDEAYARHTRNPQEMGGVGRWLVNTMKTMVSRTHGDKNFGWVDVPEDLQALGVLMLLAPKGVAVPDLFDPEDMVSLIGARDYGVTKVACRDDWCLLMWPPPGAEPDQVATELQRLLEFLRPWVERES